MSETTHVPVCAWCGKVRDETGQWRLMGPVEAQRINQELAAGKTHGICPGCAATFRLDSRRSCGAP